MSTNTLIAYVLFSGSVAIYGVFWIWAMIHAGSTPHAPAGQRALWVGSMLVNPSAAVWYWYIWKRWAFWLLFTPILGLFVSLPFIVRSLLTKAEATQFTDILFSLSSSSGVLVLIACLIAFQLLLRLAALLHLGRNAELDALDRNDWVVALALPVFGFGAGFSYCVKYRRRWAFASLVWWVAMAFSARYVWNNVNQTLQQGGEERREEFKSRPVVTPSPRLR